MSEHDKTSNVSIGQKLEDLNALVALGGHPGWKVILAKFDERFEELTKQALDHNSPDDEANRARQARGRILHNLSPHILMRDLLAHLQASAAAELKKKNPPPE